MTSGGLLTLLIYKFICFSFRNGGSNYIKQQMCGRLIFEMLICIFFSVSPLPHTHPIFGFPEIKELLFHEGELFVSVNTLLSFFIAEVHRRDTTAGEESERNMGGRENWKLKGEREIMNCCEAVP